MGSDHSSTAPLSPPAPDLGMRLRGWTRRPLAAFRRYRADVLPAIFAATVDVLAYTTATHDPVRTRIFGLVLILLGAAFLLARRRYPLRVAGAVIATHLVFVLLTRTLEHSYGGALVIALYTVARYLGTREIWGIALVATAVQVLRNVGEDSNFAGMLVADAATTALVVVTGLGTARWQQQLGINRQLLADRAVTEERRRIARELHDIVAHHITTMYLMSGGARATLEREPETAREALITLEASGRAALREMRQLLGVLRSTDGPEEAPSQPQPGVEEIDRLVAESRAAGLPVEYEEFGEQQPLPPATGLTLYRIVQEALTNTRKHAGNPRTRVQVRHLPDRIVVEVVDDGTGNAATTGIVGSGYGLMGMRERIALHGGTLETGRRPEGGFRVLANVPLSGDGPDWTR
ncbi:sensor histidine kinase [Embleya sp. AB8]|uniref:sensor histidine kinase n=1 Tax=Embleya sp. AB8 TaxID=3156304 RepID=UPI003C7297EA